LYPFLFLLVIYFVTGKAMVDLKFDIVWKQNRLKDLDFADDIHQQIDASDESMTNSLIELS
jgi:hypothetical protein